MTKKQLLARLEELLRQKEVMEGFKSREECLTWSNTVAPLLSFNKQYYDAFVSSAHRLTLPLSSYSLDPAFRTMLSQAQMAVAQLRLEIEDEVESHQAPGSKSSGLAAPDIVTIRWLLDHVRFGLWVAAGSVLLTMFVAGLLVGQTNLARELIRITGLASIPSDGNAPAPSGSPSVFEPEKSPVQESKPDGEIPKADPTAQLCSAIRDGKYSKVFCLGGRDDCGGFSNYEWSQSFGSMLQQVRSIGGATESEFSDDLEAQQTSFLHGVTPSLEVSDRCEQFDIGRPAGGCEARMRAGISVVNRLKRYVCR